MHIYLHIRLQPAGGQCLIPTGLLWSTSLSLPKLVETRKSVPIAIELELLLQVWLALVQYPYYLCMCMCMCVAMEYIVQCAVVSNRLWMLRVLMIQGGTV